MGNKYFKFGIELITGAYMRSIMIILICGFCLSACGTPRPMTFEEQQAYMAQEQCAQEASDFNPDGQWDGNPFWSSYFVMCMHNMGVSNAVLNRMWY